MPSFRGKPACTCLAQWLPVYEAELKRLGVIKNNIDIWQLIGGAKASGGTHSTGGAFDIAQRDAVSVKIAREMGAAFWNRPKNWDNRGGMAHGHGVLNGCPHNGPARYQIGDLARGLNGLANHAKDAGPAPRKLRTWTEGIKWAKARQAVKPATKPKPTPGPKPPVAPGPKPPVATGPKPPVATGPTVTSTSLNAGSYNGPGAKTYKTRTDRYVKRRTTSEVDVINLQEVGNGPNVKGKPNCYMRGRLDKGFGDLYRRHIGADGRYCYSNPGRVKPIKSGVIVAAKSTWYRKDDKQASYLVYEKAGVKAMDVSFHLESEPGAEADGKRVASMLSIVAQALVIAKANGVDRRNILFVGDTNSAGMVARAMAEAGWRNVAAGGKYENRHTYMGWDGKARERFDYGFVHEDAGPAFMNVIHEDTDISDHAELVIKRTLTR